MNFREYLLYSTVFATGLIALSTPAGAQTTTAGAASQPAESGQVEDIVVTARKLGENLQTTPVAVTAVTPAALVNQQITQINDLARAAPNFTALGGGTGGSMIGNFSLRGQAQSNPGSSNDAPVAVYIDGVYYARPMTNNGATLDLASAEVLRGPQGTLFGRNTTGGALNLTTQSPTDAFEGSFKAGIGNYRSRVFEAVVNIPLSDDVSTRWVGKYDTHDGYVFNANSNTREGDADNYFVRGSLKWTPKALPLTLRLIGDYTNYSDNGTPSKINAVDPAGALGGLAAGLAGLASDFYTTVSGVTAEGSLVNNTLHFPAGFGASGNAEIDTPHNSVIAKGASADLTIDIGETKVRSISAYRDSDAKNSWDLDGTPINGLAFASQYISHQFSQELQISGKSGAFDWITGIYYFHEGGSERSDAWQFISFSRDFTHYRSTSTGVFAQGIFHLTDQLRATGGLRYTWDSRFADLRGVFGGAAVDYSDALCGEGPTLGQPATPSCGEVRSSKFHYPAWLASIDYQVSPTLFAYLKSSGASMAGGVNFRYTGNPAFGKFSPEHVRDLEFGVKADLLDRHLRMNAAAFYIWRRGLQTNVNPVLPVHGPTQYQINAGKARQYGGEFELTATPWAGMEVNGSLAYLHSAYVPGTYVLLGIDHSSDPIAQSPEWTWNIGATQKVPVGNGELLFHADYSYVATYYQYPDATSAASLAAGSIPGHGLLNARIAYTLANPNVELSVWGRNLTKTKYLTSIFSGAYEGLGVATANPGTPRTYGVTLGYKW